MIKIFHLSDIHLDSPFSLCSAGEAEHIIKNLRCNVTFRHIAAQVVL